MLEHAVMLAQAAPIDPTGWVDFLLGQGVLGFVVAVLLYFLVKKDSQVDKVTEQRLEDLKTVSEIIRNQTVAMEANTKMNEQDHQSLEAFARLIDKQMLILEQLTKTVNDSCKR